MKKISLILVALMFSLYLMAQQDLQPLNNPYFKAVYALRAEGEFINVNTGHAAPYIYDYNKDGINDLLVGEFGKVYCPGVDTTQAHSYIQGRCRIYINYGSNQQPVYKDFQWLMAGGKPAFVPITCCISFVPRFVDLNGDGIDDVISGSYPGDIYFFKGLKNNQYAEPIILKDQYGDTLRPAHSMAADPIDWDMDGDYDLLVSSRGGGTYLIRNIGSKNDYKFDRPQAIHLEDYDYVYEYLEQKRKDIPSYLTPQDWDGDGLFDLIGGSEWGDLVFYKNIGTPGNPQFAKPITMFDNNNDFSPCELGEMQPLGGRVKTWVYDYDGDGKLDILAGDSNSAFIKIRDLTPKEEILKNKIEKELNLISKRFYGDNGLYRLQEKGKTSDKEQKEFKKLTEKNNILNKKLEKLKNYKDGESCGFVWVFLRK